MIICLNFDDLPRFDLIVNCLSCPDHDAKGLELIQRFLEQCPHIPVINAPRHISRTSRAENARRLGRFHVSMPRTELFQCDQGFDRVISQFEQAGFSYPVLVRRPGSHGANKMTKVDSSAALHDWLMAVKAAPGIFMSTPYVDYRWIDGLFHAFRAFLLMVRSILYPISLATIGRSIVIILDCVIGIV